MTRMPSHVLQSPRLFSLVARLALALPLLSLAACATLSPGQRDHAAAIAAAARSHQVDCDREDRCAQPSALRALAGEALAESTPSAPRHYALILDRGEDALLSRVNLIRSATRSIDLQTYIFDHDDSARLVLDELIAAARRGVKVRLLIDQLSAISDLDILGALAGVHANFEVRIYNPTFGKARLNYFDYAASVVCCFRRFNQRMHTKLILIDDAVGITGGRNYQDDYYDWDGEYNFRDRDVMVAGPVARMMARNFDAFWQARRSVPVERLNDVGRRLLASGVPALPPAAFVHPDRVQRLSDEADDEALVGELADEAMPVGAVEFAADLPQKHRREAARQVDATAPQLDTLIAGARSEILLQTPYLVLSKPAQALFRSLRQRAQPPRIDVSTSSLAATDNPIVYAVSFKYRRRYMREMGFNIHEYKPFPEDPPQDRDDVLPTPPGSGDDAVERRLRFGSSGHGPLGSRGGPDASRVERKVLRTETRPSYLRIKPANRPLPVTRKGVRMGLHAKSMVVDEQIAVIGTHNFDPRSEHYNTESAVIVHDAAFARALAASIERDIAPGNSWTVAPRARPPVLSGLNYSAGKLSESLPVLDVWPWRYATDYAFQPGPECPLPLRRQDPDFGKCYKPVGDFPEVSLGPKWLFVRMLVAFGGGLVPIL